MEKGLNIFFTSILVNALEKLKADSKAEWGIMTAKQMIIHLKQQLNHLL